MKPNKRHPGITDVMDMRPLTSKSLEKQMHGDYDDETEHLESEGEICDLAAEAISALAKFLAKYRSQ